MFFTRHIGTGWKIIIIVLIFLSLIFIFLQKTIVPVFFSLAEAEAVRIANRVINEVVDQQTEYIKYDDLIKYDLNEDGYIILMQQNTRFINRLISSISLNIQNGLEKIKDRDVSIPLFRIFGLDIFAGLGPDFTARIIPVGFVTPPEVLDSFESAGINQTRHKIYLKINVELRLIVPFNSRSINVTADVPVTEVTLLGRVPQVYVGISGEELPGIISRSLGDQ